MTVNSRGGRGGPGGGGGVGSGPGSGSGLARLRTFADLFWPMILRAGVVEPCMVADEIVNQERGFADARTQAAATPAHLRVFDGGCGGPKHHKIFNFLVVVAGVEHVHGNRNDGQRVELETVNDGPGIAIVRVAGDFLRETLADFGGRTVRLLRDAQARGIGEKLVEQPFQHHRLFFADGKHDGFARMRLRAFFLDAEVFINDELESVFALGGASPIAKADFLVFPVRALEREDGFGGINFVVGEKLFLDAFADGIGEGRAAFLRGAVPAIEKHVGAADELAFVFAHPMEFAGIRRGGQADVDGVKMRERGAVRVVNGAMALVRDDQIKIGMAETARPKLPGNRVQRADDDLTFERFFAAEKQRGRIFAQVVVKRVLLGLPRQFNAVGQEQDAGNHGSLHPPFDEHGDGERLARAGRFLKQHPPPPGNQRVIGGFEAADLIRPRLNIFALETEVRRHGHCPDGSCQIALPVLAEIGAAFEVGLRGKTDDWPGVAVLVIPEVMLAPVAQDDERSAETDGVFLGLRLRRVGINGKSFRFDDAQRPGAGIFQEIISASVRCGFFRGDDRLVFNVPIRLAQEAVNHDSGICFSWHE